MMPKLSSLSLVRKIEVDWEKQDTPMVSRRILITQPKMNGKQLGEFHFSSMYGVNVTRVNRSGMDIFCFTKPDSSGR